MVEMCPASNVPEDLFSLILSKLCFKDRGGFKLVCKSWNLICPLPPVLPPLVNSSGSDSPCLMICQRSSYSWKIFHSLYNDYYFLNFPELVDTEILYCKNGWLLMSKIELMLFFFNPFTKEKIELPPITKSFLGVCFSAPPTSSNCVVFGILSSSTGFDLDFSFIKVGDAKWEYETLDHHPNCFWISNCPPVFLNGVYYYLNCRLKDIMTFDLNKDKYVWIQCGKYFDSSISVDEEEEEDDEEDEDEDGEEEEEDEDENGGEEDENEDEDEEEDKKRGEGAKDRGEEQEKKHEEEEEDDEEKEEEEEEEKEDEQEITHQSYIVEVEGNIWGVFITNFEKRVRVKKLDLSKRRWVNLESLGDKCLYVSTNGSFAETPNAKEMANKIYFDKFYGKSGVIYSLTSGMYYSVGGGFASEDVFGLTEMDFGVWVKPTIDS